MSGVVVRENGRALERPTRLLDASMSQSTLPGVNSSDTTDASDDDQDDVACACEYGAPGCLDHYQGGSRLEEADGA